MSSVRVCLGFIALLVMVGCDAETPAVGSVHSVTSGKKNVSSIVMGNSTIAFSGASVSLGEPLAAWKSAIPGTPRCTSEKHPPTICTWDELGLELGTDDTHKLVKFLNLYLKVPGAEELESHSTTLPDGGPVPPSTSPAPPKFPFSGVLELDTFKFDGKTEFRKIRAGIDQKREVRCGLRDCANPHGSFGKMDDIYFRLNDGDERSTVATVSLSHVPPP